MRMLVNAAIVCTSIALHSVASATPLFNIDFGNSNGSPASTYGAAAGQAGTWNTISTMGTVGALVDITGATTGVSVTTSGSGFGNAADPKPLLGDMLWRSGGNWTVSFAGLTDGQYDIFYYAPLHPMHLGDVTINGTTVDSMEGSIDTLVQGTSWNVLQSVTVSGGVLNLASGPVPPEGIQYPWTGIAGLQITTATTPTASEPGILGLLLIGGLLTVAVKRRS